METWKVKNNIAANTRGVFKGEELKRAREEKRGKNWKENVIYFKLISELNFLVRDKKKKQLRP